MFLAGRRLPLAPLLSALIRAGWPAARWGHSFWWGAAISAAISLDQDAERSQPHSDGCASLRCQPVAPFLHATIRTTTPCVPMSYDSDRAGWFSAPSLRRLLAIAQRFIRFPRHPQPVQQHRQLSRYRNYRSLLGILAPSLADPLPEPPQIAVFSV